MDAKRRHGMGIPIGNGAETALEEIFHRKCKIYYASLSRTQVGERVDKPSMRRLITMKKSTLFAVLLTSVLFIKI